MAGFGGAAAGTNKYLISIKDMKEGSYFDLCCKVSMSYWPLSGSCLKLRFTCRYVSRGRMGTCSCNIKVKDLIQRLMEELFCESQ